jgi:hypothetical protein
MLRLVIFIPETRIYSCIELPANFDNSVIELVRNALTCACKEYYISFYLQHFSDLL